MDQADLFLANWMAPMISMDGFFRGLRPENHRFYREKTRAFRQTSWPFTVGFLRATGWAPMWWLCWLKNPYEKYSSSSSLYLPETIEFSHCHISTERYLGGPILYNIPRFKGRFLLNVDPTFGSPSFSMGNWSGAIPSGNETWQLKTH